MAKEYEVLDIQERTRIDARGKIETYYVFSVKSAKGTIFTVRLGEDQLDEATSKMIIGARVKQLDALKG